MVGRGINSRSGCRTSKESMFGKQSNGHVSGVQKSVINRVS